MLFLRAKKELSCAAVWYDILKGITQNRELKMIKEIDPEVMPDLRYPLLSGASLNTDLRGAHTKYYGKGPKVIALPFDYPISEVFITTSNKNIVRGMHFQIPGQPKLISIITGSIHGNLLCCDPELPEFGKTVKFTLEPDQRLLVPGKWALGYRSLEDATKILYLAGADFVPGGDAGVDPFDAELDLDWGVAEDGSRFTAEHAILSDKDKELPSFAEWKKSAIEGETND